jgi:hypothetical protein
MSYPYSTHFSDKLSYKKLCISSYRLKDMNFARYAHLQQYFSKTEKLTGTFLTQRTLGREADTWGPRLTGTLTKHIWRCGADRGWQEGLGCQIGKQKERPLTTAQSKIRTQDLSN